MNADRLAPLQPNISAPGLMPGASVATHPAADEHQARLRVEELQAWAYVSLYTDPKGARRSARAALDLARVGRFPASEAWSALSLALAYLHAGALAPGSVWLTRAEALIMQLEDPRAAWLAADARALQMLRQDRPDDALIELMRLMIGTPDNRPARDCYITASTLTNAHAALGHAEEALGAAYRALSIARRTRSMGLRIHAMGVLGRVQLDLSNLEGACLALEQSLEGARRIGSSHLGRAAAADLVRACSARGNIERATELARRHLPGAPRSARQAVALAQACLLDGRGAEVETALAAWPKDDGCGVARAWIRARLRLASGEPEKALACALSGERALTPATPPLDAIEVLSVLNAALTALGDRSGAAKAETGRAERQAALAAAAQRAQTLSQQFEDTLLQAHPVCCEVAGRLCVTN